MVQYENVTYKVNLKVARGEGPLGIEILFLLACRARIVLL